MKEWKTSSSKTFSQRNSKGSDWNTMLRKVPVMNVNLSFSLRHTHMLTYTVPSISYCTYILKNCKPLYSYWSADFLKLNCHVSLCSWYVIDFLRNVLRKKIWQSCRTKRRSQFYLVDNLIMQQLTTTFLFLSPAFLWELLLK